MELSTYNPQKGRLETLEVVFTEENTTWFEYSRSITVSTITDFKGGILIKIMIIRTPSGCTTYREPISTTARKRQKSL